MKRTIITIFSLLFIAMLHGCSRQSATDFTPYPAQRGTALLQVLLDPSDFTLSDGTGIRILEAKAAINAAALTNPEILLKASIAAHEGEEEGEVETGTPAVPDSNREGGDSRLLVTGGLDVNRTIDLLQPSNLGSLEIREGTNSGWMLSCATGTGDPTATFSLLIRGVVTSGTVTASLSVLIDEPFGLALGSGDPIYAGQTFVPPRLDPRNWFEGFNLGGLIASGPIVIDEDHHELVHEFLERLTGTE